jgi:DNA repair exonuclease SbcCD ATPase subunit
MDKYKKEYEDITDKLNECKKKYDKIKKQKENYTIEHKEKSVMFAMCKSNYDKYVEDKNDRNIYTIIHNLLMKNGLIDNILKDEVIVKLERVSNMILHNIGYNPIKIIIKEKKGNKYKNSELIIYNKNNTKSDYYGYFEKNITELTLRLALSQCNRFINSNIIISDEPYDGSSVINFSKVEELIKLFKMYYKFNLVITHDEKITKLFDKRIRIIKSENNDEYVKDGCKVICDDK